MFFWLGRMAVTPVRTGPRPRRSGPAGPRMMVECPTSTPSTSVMAFHFPGLKRPSGIPSSRARTRCSTPVLYPDFFRNAIADPRPRPYIRTDGAQTRPARTGRPPLRTGFRLSGRGACPALAHRRSALRRSVQARPGRAAWQHSIPASPDLRYSITFRTLRAPPARAAAEPTPHHSLGGAPEDQKPPPRPPPPPPPPVTAERP